MAAEEYATGGRAEPAGSSGDFLALHRRAAASLRRTAAESGAKKRAVRTIRALAKGSGAIVLCCCPSMPSLQMNQRAGPRQPRSTVPPWRGVVIALTVALATTS